MNYNEFIKRPLNYGNILLTLQEILDNYALYEGIKVIMV